MVRRVYNPKTGLEAYVSWLHENPRATYEQYQSAILEYNIAKQFEGE